MLDYLILPPIVGWDVTRWAGGRVLDTIGFTPNLSSGKKDEHAHLEAMQTLHAISYAAAEGDPRFLDVTLRKVPDAIELERLTALKIMAKGVAQSYIRDAGKREGRKLEMTEDRRLAFKRLLSEHLHEGETFESIGVEEAFLPTLRTYHPEFAAPPHPEFEDFGPAES